MINYKYFGYNMKFLLLMVLFFFVSFEYVSADAWWGEGYRSPEWVRAHGGTTITYKITGTSHPDDYKAMMFRDGKYVEVEFGKHAVFDDAKNGTYVINFYKCDDCTRHRTDKKTKIRDKDKLVASISIVARPGEGVNLIFDASNNTVRIVGVTGRPKPVDPFIAQKKAAQQNEGEMCEYEDVKKETNLLETLSLLSHKVDLENFREANVKNGILPNFAPEKTEETA
ncbi:MAG: hypothetical protein ABFQ53_03950 [Patescibacteria group bacterium]